jgi:hypothetical protein
MPSLRQLADGTGCGTCDIDQPDTPVLPPTPEDGSGCSNCATPPLSSHRAAFRPIVLATQ